MLTRLVIGRGSPRGCGLVWRGLAGAASLSSAWGGGETTACSGSDRSSSTRDASGTHETSHCSLWIRKAIGNESKFSNLGK